MNAVLQEVQNETPTKKPATEVVTVEMEDGRKVDFAGKRRMIKDLIVEDNQLAVRFDFRNGMTLTAVIPEHHVRYAAAHGYAQKLGDEVAGMKAEDGSPASEEDMLLAIEALHNRLNESADWRRVSSGEESVSGAHVVIKAIAEVSGKTVADVKAFLQRKLDEAKARGEKLSRKALYDSFRRPGSKTAEVISRLEAEKKTKEPAVNSDDLLNEIAG